MFIHQGSERMLVCDKCRRGVMYVLARTDAAIRRCARQDRWTTARGRDLCRECTAQANALAEAAKMARNEFWSAPERHV